MYIDGGRITEAGLRKIARNSGMTHEEMAKKAGTGVREIKLWLEKYITLSRHCSHRLYRGIAGGLVEIKEEIPSWGRSGYPTISVSYRTPEESVLGKLRGMVLHKLGLPTSSWSFLDHASKTQIGRNLDTFLETGELLLRVVKNESPNGQIVIRAVKPSGDVLIRLQRDTAMRNRRILSKKAKGRKDPGAPWWTKEYLSLPHTEKTRMGVMKARGEMEKKWGRPVWGNRSDEDESAINRKMKERVLKHFQETGRPVGRRLHRKHPPVGKVLGHRVAKRLPSGGYDMSDDDASL